MRQFVLGLILLVSFLFPTTGFAEWVMVSEGTFGDKYYIDHRRVIRKPDTFVYVSVLMDLVTPDKDGTSSSGTSGILIPSSNVLIFTLYSVLR